MVPARCAGINASGVEDRIDLQLHVDRGRDSQFGATHGCDRDDRKDLVFELRGSQVHHGAADQRDMGDRPAGLPLTFLAQPAEQRDMASQRFSITGRCHRPNIRHGSTDDDQGRRVSVAFVP